MDDKRVNELEREWERLKADAGFHADEALRLAGEGFEKAKRRVRDLADDNSGDLEAAQEDLEGAMDKLESAVKRAVGQDTTDKP